MACYLVALSTRQFHFHLKPDLEAIWRTSSNAMRFCTSNAIRESRYRTSFSRTKFFFDCDDIFAFRSRNAFCAAPRISLGTHIDHVSLLRHTSCKIVLYLQIPLVGVHRQVQRRDRVPLRCAHRARAILRAHGILAADLREGGAGGGGGARGLERCRRHADGGGGM